MKITIKHVFISIALAAMMGMACSAQSGGEVFSGVVYANGEAAYCISESNEMLPFLRYLDTTYIPVRTAGEWMKKSVEWNNNTQAIELSGVTLPHKVELENVKPGNFNVGDTVSVIMRADIAISIDGKLQKFVDVKGKAVYPIMYNDVTYLPLRNIGEMTGLEVSWARQSVGHDIVFLREPVDPEALMEVREYIYEQCKLLEKSDLLLKEIRATATTADVSGLVLENAKFVEQMKSMKKPTAEFAQYWYNERITIFDDVETVLGKMRIADGAELRDLAITMLRTQMGAASRLIQLSIVTEQTGKSDVPYVLNNF